MNFNNMTQDEIIKYLMAENKKLNQQITSQGKIIDKLMVENRDYQIKYNKLLIEFEEKEIIIKRFLKDKFYTTSEVLPKVKEENILNEAEVILENKEKVKRGRKTGGKNSNNLIQQEGLEEVTIDFTEEEFEELKKSHDLVLIGEDIVVKLVKSPAVYTYVKFRHPKYKDKKNPELIFQSEVNDAFKKCIITSSVASDIINNKMNLGVPLERQAQFLSSNGIMLSSNDLAHYIMKSSEILTPLYDKMKEALVKNDIKSIHSDETPVQVLDSKDRQTSYMYVLTTSFWEKPIYIYDFSLTRKTDNIEALLEGYDGYLTVDGYAGYDKFKKGGEKELKGVALCWAHLRRYFVNADPEMMNKNKKRKKETDAEHVVHLIDKVFHKEKYFKEMKYTIPQITEARNNPEYLKLLDDIYNYVTSLNVDKDIKLKEAKKYALNNWNEFKTYLKYGGIDLTNSIAERTVRPFAVARNSFLFCKSEKGAKATGILFSIVQTARANGLSVEKYLNYVFNNIGMKTATELLPWSENIPDNIKIKIK